MKKGLKIVFGSITGLVLLGALTGSIYALNTNVKNWIDNKISDSFLSDEYKDVKISLDKIETNLDTDLTGVQKDDSTSITPYARKISISGFKDDYEGKKLAKLSLNSLNYSKFYFTKNESSEKYYDSVTVSDGDIIYLNHELFSKENESYKASITMSLLEESKVRVSYDFLFKYDNSVKEEKTSEFANVKFSLTKSSTEKENAGIQTYSYENPLPFIRDVSITGFPENFEGDKRVKATLTTDDEKIYVIVGETTTDKDKVYLSDGDVLTIGRNMDGTKTNYTSTINIKFTLVADETISFNEEFTFNVTWVSD